MMIGGAEPAVGPALKQRLIYKLEAITRDALRAALV